MATPDLEEPVSKKRRYTEKMPPGGPGLRPRLRPEMESLVAIVGGLGAPLPNAWPVKLKADKKAKQAKQDEKGTNGEKSKQSPKPKKAASGKPKPTKDASGKPEDNNDASGKPEDDTPKTPKPKNTAAGTAGVQTPAEKASEGGKEKTKPLPPCAPKGKGTAGGRTYEQDLAFNRCYRRCKERLLKRGVTREAGVAKASAEAKANWKSEWQKACNKAADGQNVD